MAAPTSVLPVTLGRVGDATPLEWLRRICIGLLGLWMVTAGLTAERPVVGVCVGLVVAGALMVSPRWPLTSLVAAYAFIPAMEQLAGYGGPDDVTVLVVALANFLFGRFAAMSRQPFAVAGIALFVSVVGEANRDALQITDLVFPVVFVTVPWLFGVTLQVLDARARTAEEEVLEVETRREEQIQSARRDERLQIARELHDVVAHGVSVVSLQAQVARRRLESGGSVSVGDLEGIETAARGAMTELRSLLAVMRPYDQQRAPLEPAPGVADLPRLVDQSCAAGHACELVSRGQESEIPEGMSLAVYRMVQESVTNAWKHGAPGAPVSIRLEWEPTVLVVEVQSSIDTGGRGRREADVAVEPGGHGLVGIAERVALYGGAMRCGPVQGGAVWSVRAELPLPVRAETP